MKSPKLDTLDMKVLGYFLPYDPFLEPQTKTPSWQQILGPCFLPGDKEEQTQFKRIRNTSD